MSVKEERVLQMAESLGYLTASQVAQVVHKHRQKGGNLLQMLLQDGYLNASQIAHISQ